MMYMDGPYLSSKVTRVMILGGKDEERERERERESKCVCRVCVALKRGNEIKHILSKHHHLSSSSSSSSFILFNHNPHHGSGNSLFLYHCSGITNTHIHTFHYMHPSIHQYVITTLLKTHQSLL